MKKQSLFINLSRGHVVDLSALTNVLKSKHIRGAAIDVFPEEPTSNSELFESTLRNQEHVILTPHIAGSTEEAQKNIGGFVPKVILDYLATGNTYQSVNFPTIQLPPLKESFRLIHLHDNVPGVLARINQVFAKRGINILGQYLKTNEQVGYVITDVAPPCPDEVLDELRVLEHTITFRTV